MRRQHVAQPAIVRGAHAVGVRVAHARPAGDLGDQDRGRRAATLHLARLPAGRGTEQRAIVGEDRLLQALELRSGTQAELAIQRPDRVAVGVQRLALTPGSIQGEHELPAQALAQRLRRHEPLQLRHELGTAAHRQIGLDAILDRGRAQVLQARDLGRRERLEHHVGQRRPAPLRQRRAQPRRRALVAPGRQRAPPVRAQLREAAEVKFVRLDAQPVAGRAADQPRRLAAERASQPRDHRLHRLDHAGGRPLAPQVRDQAFARDRLPRVQQQHGQQRPLPRAGQRQRPTLRPRLDRSQDPEIHRSRFPPSDARCNRCHRVANAAQPPERMIGAANTATRLTTKEISMTTLTRTYATEVAARRAVEALRATGVPERDIRLLAGSAPRDIRREPVGGSPDRSRPMPRSAPTAAERSNVARAPAASPAIPISSDKARSRTTTMS